MLVVRSDDHLLHAPAGEMAASGGYAVDAIGTNTVNVLIGHQEEST